MDNQTRDKILMEIHSIVHANKGLIERHDKTLYGNGQPGLCARLKEIEMKQVINTKWKLGILTTASALFGGGIASIIGAIVKKMI